MLKNLSILKTNFGSADGLGTSPSAIPKFVLSILNFFRHTQFLKYTQNVFGLLKS
jgi:hypothetical protein